MTTNPTPRTGTVPAEDDSSDGTGLSGWRRPRQLRRQLARTLVLIALASVVLVGGLNFVAARTLLDDGTTDQLVGVGEARARSIELGIDRVLSQVSGVAADLAVVDAMEELNEAFGQLGNEALEVDQRKELDEFYEAKVVYPLNETGVLGRVTLGDVLPTSDEARYLQFQYIVSQRDLDERRAVTDPGDGSAYSGVHAMRHPYLAELESSLGAADLMLVSTEGDIVYSAEKLSDFGTSLAVGPLSDSNLADTVLRELTRVRVGQAVLVNQEIYLPGGAQPTLFVAAGIRSDTEVIGALVIRIPVDALNTITTANNEWEAVGLSSGESYVVGSDQLLVTESRLWIQDPGAYMDKTKDSELIALIEVFGSPVGIQIVNTEPVAAALEGRTFSGVTKNYLQQETFSYGTPINSPGVEWVVVTDIPIRDAHAPLYDYAFRLGLVLLIVLPVAAIIGVWLAGRLTRPIGPVVAAAIAVAGGARDPDVPDHRQDEFGDLARRLKLMAGELERHETALAEEYEDRRSLLLTVLPKRVVEAKGVVTGSGDAAETATVIAVALHVSPGEMQSGESDISGLLSSALERAEALADEFDVERVRASSDQYLFVAGIGSDSELADTALEFTVALSKAIHGLSEAAEIPLGVHIGLASGPVATGMLQRGVLTFAAWGEPVRRSLAIGALSKSDEVLVDASTAEVAVDQRWAFAPARDIVDLDGQPMTVFTLSSDVLLPDPAPEPATDTADTRPGEGH